MATNPQSVRLSARPFSARFFDGVDLGLDPAIEADGARHTAFDRRRVSLRWFSGTILTGVSGGALFAAAIYAALGHESYFAEAPSPAIAQRRETNADFGINPRKADRLVKAVDIVAAKQSFRAPTAIKVGEKEVMKVHNFTRVETTLVLADAGFGDEVPPYNPLKVLANARNPVDVAPEPVQDDAEVAWTMRDVSPEAVSPNFALSLDEAQAQVGEQAASQGVGAKAIPLPPQLLLMRTSRANVPGVLAYGGGAEQPIMTAPFSSIEVRMVPENVTNVARSVAAAQVTQMDERLVVMRHGETLEEVLRTAGVAQAAITGVIAAFGARRGESPVAEGRRIKLLFADLDGLGEKMSLARLCVYNDETLETTIAINDRGDYLRVTPPQRAAAAKRAAPSADSEDDDGDGMSLYDSLYQTALKQDIPRPIIDELVRVFANDVDFQRPVTGGDSFEAFYDDSEEGEGRNQLLYAAITARNETFHYYRFQTPDDGLVDYYDQFGRSTRKFLVRTPILGAKFTSGFGMRFHPILGYSRPHTGVDWAAPIGTPVFAAGNGQVLSVGWDAGYGRRIELQHANGYVTTYNHLSGFARGVAEGASVRQGQVIGYLGQTGLATGPHLHYEVLVNGHFVDPMRVKLARTREFDGRMLANFKRERDRIDALLAKAPSADRVVASSQGK